MWASGPRGSVSASTCIRPAVPEVQTATTLRSDVLKTSPVVYTSDTCVVNRKDLLDRIWKAKDSPLALSILINHRSTRNHQLQDPNIV